MQHVSCILHCAGCKFSQFTAYYLSVTPNAKYIIAVRRNFNSIKRTLSARDREPKAASEIHYRNISIESTRYVYRAVHSTAFSFRIRDCVLMHRTQFGCTLRAIVNSQRMKLLACSAHRQHQYNDNGVRSEFLARHERTDLTYVMRRLHLISPRAWSIRSLFLPP